MFFVLYGIFCLHGKKLGEWKNKKKKVKLVLHNKNASPIFSDYIFKERHSLKKKKKVNITKK